MHSECRFLEFSPDGNWLAYAKPLYGERFQVFVHALRTQRSFPVSRAFDDDREPRWDPAGKYLYFLSNLFLKNFPFLSVKLIVSCSLFTGHTLKRHA